MRICSVCYDGNLSKSIKKNEKKSVILKVWTDIRQTGFVIEIISGGTSLFSTLQLTLDQDNA